MQVHGRHGVEGPEELVAGYKLVLGTCYWIKANNNVTIHVSKFLKFIEINFKIWLTFITAATEAFTSSRAIDIWYPRKGMHNFLTKA